MWWVDPAEPAPRCAREALSPTFLAQHPAGRRLYAVSEVAPGLLTVFGPEASPDPDPDDEPDARSHPSGALRTQAVHDTGGSHPCHVAVDPDGRWLVVAHYGDGVVSVFPLDAAGDVAAGPVRFPPTGVPGPRADRQDGPHAHSATLDPGGAVVLVADLGTDELRRYRLSVADPPEADGVACRLPAGSGPRHVAFGVTATTATVYVTLELSAEVAVLSWDARTGTASLRDRQPLPLAARGGPTLASHLVVDGDRLLVGVRGPDVIVAFRIADDGALTRIGETPTVAWPRHFAVLGDWLVVAGERADALGRHPLNGPDGGVGELVHRDFVPAPACVVDAAGWRS